MAGKSPTQCTLDKWRKAGYVCAVVERFNPHVKIRQDLFGFIDVLAVGNGETVAIQTTSRSHVSNRIRKIEDDEDKIFKAITQIRKANWRIIVEGWYKQKNRWQCREVDIS